MHILSFSIFLSLMIKLELINTQTFYFFVNTFLTEHTNYSEVTEADDHIIIHFDKIHYLNSVYIDISEKCSKKIKSWKVGSKMTKITEGSSYPNVSGCTFNIQAYSKLLIILGDGNIVNLSMDAIETKIENYVGCFKLIKKLSFMTFFKGAFDVNTCERHCSHWTFYAVNAIGECMCISNMTDLIPANFNKCHETCTNYHQLCGGRNVFSVYSKNPVMQIRKPKNETFLCSMYSRNCLICPKGKKGINCDIIDCSTDSKDVCGKNKECTNLNWMELNVGVCTCKNGYMFNNDFKCIDPYECQNESLCGEPFICRNTNGTDICTCQKGFEVHLNVCRDFDECASGQQCDNVSTFCINEHGTFLCSCKTGFENLDDESSLWRCQDIDECMQDMKCDRNSTYCSNEPGFYTCECFRGYRRTTKFGCSDIDECIEFKHNCGKESMCTNTLGSYHCKCPEGYVGFIYNYAVECHDRNECSEPDACDNSVSFCLNIPMSYICQCNPGYVNIDNFTCIRTGNLTTVFGYNNTIFSTDDYEVTTISIFEEYYDIGMFTLVVVLVTFFILCFLVNIFGGGGISRRSSVTLSTTASV